MNLRKDHYREVEVDLEDTGSRKRTNETKALTEGAGPKAGARFSIRRQRSARRPAVRSLPTADLSRLPRALSMQRYENAKAEDRVEVWARRRK